jgi:hypothetical protein
MSVDDLSRGIDLQDTAHRSQQLVHRGLDLSNPDVTTEEEKTAFRTHYQAQFGYDHRGLDFWLDNGPAILKRYRLWAGLTVPVRGGQVAGSGYLAYYALLGYEDGVRYVLPGRGKNRQYAMEQVGIAFLHCGPAGMETIARALEGMTWPEQDEPLQYRAPYLPDPEAFSTGIDFSSPDLTPEELDKIEAWYQRYLGEVPGHVRFLGEHRPAMLKAHRNRIEHLLQISPKQSLPMALLHFFVLTGHGPGIRENVLLARGFGVRREDLLSRITNALAYAGPEGASLVYEVAGKEISEWPEELS